MEFSNQTSLKLRWVRKHRRKNMRSEKGFATLIIVIAVLIIGAGVGGFFIYQKQKTVPSTQESSAETDKNDTYGFDISKQNCSGDYVPFTYDFVDKTSVELIVPPGGTGSGKNLMGTEFKTHSFIQVKGNAQVYAPIDLTLIQGLHYLEEGSNQYLLIFESGCIRILFDHILEPVDSIRSAFSQAPSVDIDELQQSGSQIPGLVAVEANPQTNLKAGNLIGSTSGTKLAHRFDFGVYNFGKKSFLAENPEYQREWRYAYADCPYDYYPEEKQRFYYSLFASANGQDPIPKTFCRK